MVSPVTIVMMLSSNFKQTIVLFGISCVEHVYIFSINQQMNFNINIQYLTH